MKRSRAVQAFLVVSVATTLNSCGQKHEASRRCVDENGLFSDTRNCGVSGVSSGGHRYAWVYAPAGATNQTDEGRTEGRSGVTSGGTSASESTSRGVIGGEGAAHASGGGEAAGHAGGGE
jgi:hypothetical protein